MAGGGGSSGGQVAVVTGPTVAAAQAAAQAQVEAAQSAAQAAEVNTNSAIQALMGEYTTSMGINQPLVDYGNSAAGQLNYMLGLAPMTIPTAPVAPTAPTAAQFTNEQTSADINDYLESNTNVVNGGANNSFQYYDYTGVDANLYPSNVGGTKDLGAGNAVSGAVNLFPSITQDYHGIAGKGGPIAQELGSEAMQDPNDPLNMQYSNLQDIYNQQQTTYNNELPIAQNYAEKGTATSADISDVVQNLPGYQFQMQQGINGIQNAASASGMLNSGALLQQLDQFGQGVASSFYNNYMSQLQGLAGLGSGASAQQAAGAATAGQGVASQFSALGNNLGNADLAAGQAEASSYLSPAANQQIRSQDVGGGSSGGGGSAIGGILSGIGSIAGMFSSKELKDEIDRPSTREILDSVEKLDIARWKYKDTNISHLGPYAEDFAREFKVGDGRTINMIDMFGALLGSIQELSSQIKELKAGKE